jgi:predicted Zn-dependent peptidase
MRRIASLLGAVAVVCLIAAPVWGDTLEDKVKEFDLPNGMRFLVVERHEAPVVFCSIAFRVGSIYEHPGISGISHLLEHMLFKGTTTLGTKDYRAEQKYLAREDSLAVQAREIELTLEPWRLSFFDDYSTNLLASLPEEDRDAIGTDRALELEMLSELLTDKGPSAEMLAVSGLVEDGDVDYFGKYLELKKLEMRLYDTMAEHRDLIVSNELWETYMNNGARFLNAGTSYDGTFYFAYLPSNRLELFMLLESDRMANAVFREFYTERDVVMEERRMSENEPDDVLYESFMSTAYSASMYGDPVVGWMSDLKLITRADLTKYYDSYYKPNNAVGIIIGDVDFDRVRKMAERYFGPIGRGEDLPDLTTREPEQKGERRVVVTEEAKPTLTIGYHMPQRPHPDAYAMDVLSDILSGGRTSRFYKSIYEDQELTREAPSTWIGPGNRLDPLFVIDADPKDPHTLSEIENAIYAELEKLKTEPVSEHELDRIRNQTEADLVRSLGSNVGLAFRLGSYAALYGDWRELLKDVERRNAVTADDIMRVARKYFVKENRTVGWLVEQPSEQPGGEEEVDMAALMQWTRTLPPEEQRDLMTRFQMLDDQGREKLIQELAARMKAEQANQ